MTSGAAGTALSGRELIGRETVLTVLDSSATAIVTGLPGSGLSAVLDAAAGRLVGAGYCVVTGPAGRHRDTRPLSYLAGLSVPLPGPSGGRVWPAAAVLPEDPEGNVPVPLPELPWFVERIAREVLAAAAGRPVALVLGDLDVADPLSLSVLPQVRSRLRARLIGTSHATTPGRFPRPAFAALVERLPRPSRVHLSGLDDEQCLDLARTRHPAATPDLVRAVRPALGTWGCLPGLVLGVLDQAAADGTLQQLARGTAPARDAGTDRRVRLPDWHPMVATLRERGPAAAVVAAAGGPGGLRTPDLEPLATVLGIGLGRLAETVDDLTAEGVLELADGCWRCAVPALAATLAGSALPPAVAVALAVRSLASPPEAHQHETARRLAGLTDAAAAALPAMLALLVDTALTGPPGGGAGPAQPLDPASRTRLLVAVAEALERADPGSHLAGRVPRLAEAALLAFISGEERLGRRIAAAGVRWLRGVIRAPATSGAAYRELARLRAVARRSGPALGRFGTGPQAPADEPGSTWPALLLTRATLVAAADGDHATWSAAWRRWRDAGGVPARDGGDAVRALAAWGSRREVLAALEGRTAAGPVGAYLAGDWDRVAAVGRRFLAAGADPVAAPEPDELASAAVALLVAVHRREVRTARALVRRLASPDAGGRPPVVGYALAVAALREHADAREVLDLVRAELRRVRRDGPRLGVDLLLFAAARLGDVVTGGAPAGGVAPELAELAELADELGSPRAHLLAARALPPAPDRLRAALAGPAPERFLGTLGRAQAMVLLAAQLPPGDPEAADLAATAGDLIAPLRATDWLQQARGLLPVPTSPGSGARSRAMADQVRQLVGEGLTNRQISARLNLSEKSVEGYVTRLLRTYGCANRAELAARRATPTRTPPVATPA